MLHRVNLGAASEDVHIGQMS